jgi:hypothetical protein
VEHGGKYASIASNRGAALPVCSYKLVAAAGAVAIQEGAERFDVVVEQVDGDVRATWWARALAANPQYGDAQGNMATIRLGMTSRQAWHAGQAAKPPGLSQGASDGNGVELGVGVNASIAFDARALRLTGTGWATVDQTPR